MDESADDSALLDAWRGGDRAAGSRLLDRHFVAVFRFFASKLGDIAAQDLAQRTFLAAVESRDRIRDGERVRAYLLGVARNHLLMHLRTRMRRGTHIDITDTTADELSPSPTHELARCEEERLVVRALRRIPLDLQMLVELHYWEQLSTEELGRVLEIPRGTVKSRLSRARDEVRKAIEGMTNDERLRESSVQDFDRWVANLRDS